MGETSTIERLPVELQVQVLSYLNTKDLANLKTGSKHLYGLIYDNSKRIPKKKAISMIVAATLDESGKRAVEIKCGEPGEHKILLTSTQIIAKEPYYLEWGETKENILKKKHYKQQYENHLVFLESLSRNISDGRVFGPESPLPSTSMESDFQETLLFFLRRFNLDLFGLEEDERRFTSEEMGIILNVIKATGPTLGWMRRMTETIDDQYMEIIKEIKCNDLMFCGYFDHKKENKMSEYSVDKRILQVPCEQLCIYEPGIVSVSTMLLLLKEWNCGSRQINKYTYHCDQEGLDWFALVEKEFNVIKYPEDIIWTCNATIHLKTFTVVREIDDKELQFYYYGTYLELQSYPKFVALPAVIPEPNSWDDETEDLGFGLFD